MEMIEIGDIAIEEAVTGIIAERAADDEAEPQRRDHGAAAPQP